MTIERFFIEGLLLVKPDVYTDDRGYFMESFNKKRFADETGLHLDFVQDNESRSERGVLRGLHFQNPPHAQGKLVRVISGKVLDVAVDIRKNSKTYGEHYSVILSAENKHQFYIPEGFAHGFSVLENNTVFSYKCTAYYHPKSEQTLRWNDPQLNIDWKLDRPQLSEKDRNEGLDFHQLNSRF